MTGTTRDAGSFRDPAGFVYERNGEIFRRINPVHVPHFDRFIESGLCDELVRRGWLVPHEVVERAESHRTLRVSRIPYVSYPYEWCFGQLKDAALVTLDIQRASLERGLSLKDASAYNVQFIGATTVFIDTLSFETYVEGRPWVAYRQFCQHFLGPLLLLSRCDPRLRRLQSTFVDGLPVDLVSRLLPWKTWLSAGALMHVHLHAMSQRRHESDGARGPSSVVPVLPKTRLLALVDSLRRAVEGCVFGETKTTWGDYYEDTNYSAVAMDAKRAIVQEMVTSVCDDGATLHDIGANTGEFSRLLAADGRYVVAHDVDELAVERHYQRSRTDRMTSVLPLLLDLTSPSPALGWALEERASTLDRTQGGGVVALALVHHLAIANNVPLDRIAAFFARFATSLVIEFVPKDDSQVQRLLATREDIFPDYTEFEFVRAFGEAFEIVRRAEIPDTRRVLFAMRRRPATR